MFVDASEGSGSSERSWMCAYYSFQKIVFLVGVDFSRRRRDINLDFCHCTIPTVGLYGKLGEIAATLIPPPSTASIVANHRGCCQWILQQLAMLPWPPARWGEGLSILLAAGVVVQRSLRLGGHPADAR